MAKVCTLLANRFCILVNETTGLHVHVGNGAKGFKLLTVKHLIAFCWAFEPQLNSLHLPSRQDRKHCRSIRESSSLAVYYRKEVGKRLGPLAGVAKTMSYTNLEDLFRGMVTSDDSFKFMAYNLTNLTDLPASPMVL